MGNCFLIEKAAARRKLQYSWYLDERLIPVRPDAARSQDTFSVRLMPRNRSSTVGCFNGYLCETVGNR